MEADQEEVRNLHNLLVGQEEVRSLNNQEGDRPSGVDCGDGGDDDDDQHQDMTFYYFVRWGRR